MIYDCFMFFNELEVLELRLNELDEVVDRFVLVEATRTHSNLEKPLHFHDHRHLFERFSDKIIHVVVDEYPEYKDSWTYENYQRDQIARALEHCAPDDVILISDADEIPHPATLLEAARMPGIKILEQKMFYYYFNMVNFRDPLWLRGTRVLLARDFTRSATEIRLGEGTRVAGGGWHFSFLGGIDRIVTKIESFAHQEFNLDDIKDRKKIERIIKSGKDVFGRKEKRFRYRAIPLDGTFPAYLLNHRERFKDLIAEPSPVGLWNRIRNLF